MLESSKKLKYRILLGILIALMAGLTGLFIKKYDSHENAKAENIIFALVFAVICIVGLYFYLKVKDFEISTTQLIGKSFFGYSTVTIRLSDITKYTQQSLYSKYDENGEAFTVYARNGDKAIINSKLYSNYDELKSRLTKDIPRDFKLENALSIQRGKKGGIFLISLGVILLLIAYFFKESEVNPLALVFMKDMAGENVHYKRSRRHSSASLTINLMNHPEFKFKISGLGIKATDISAARDLVRIGDTIMIGITKDEFDKKIAKTVPLSFTDKYFSYSQIKVYEFRNKNTEFLSLANYNTEIENNPFKGYGYYGFINLMVIGLGIFALIKANKRANENPDVDDKNI